jgi:hypothetical protein
MNNNIDELKKGDKFMFAESTRTVHTVTHDTPDGFMFGKEAPYGKHIVRKNPASRDVFASATKIED